MKVDIIPLDINLMDVLEVIDDIDGKTLCCLQIMHFGGWDADELPAYLETQFAKCRKDDIVDVLLEVRRQSGVEFVVVDKDDEPIHERIAKQIKAILTERKLTAKAVGELIGMDAGNISKILNGKTVPSITVLHRLLTVLGVSIDLTPHYQPAPEDPDEPWEKEPEIMESHINPYVPYRL